MLWNRYETDRPFLNMYIREHFESGSGITDCEALKREILKIESDMRGQPRCIVKATAFAFVLEHGAIEVNPRGWFGVNVAGLRFGGSPKGIRFQNANSGGKTVKPLQVLCAKWKDELWETAPDEVRAAMDGIWETGAGSFWMDFDHSVPDWDAVLRYGFSGLRDRARERRAEIGILTERQRAYFDAIDITYRALVHFMNRLADSAERRICEDARMPMRAECLRRLANGAPSNIYEAMQLIYIFHLIQQYLEAVQARSFGDLDRLLYPYYLKDIDQGRFTPAQVKELFQYLFVQYDYQNHPYNQPMAIGGEDRNGCAIANELSGIICDAYYDANVSNLKIFLCLTKDTPDWLLRKTLAQVRGNRGSYVYMNFDKAAEIMARSRKMPDLKAWQVGTWGCFNLNIKGGDTDCLHTRINTAKPIELALNNGIDPITGIRIGPETGEAESFVTFEQFENAFYRQFDALLDRMIAISNFYDQHIDEINPAPMDSATLSYSLERAEDAFRYGVTNVCCSCAGTAADSLAMVRKYVYRERRLTLAQLRDILNRNWEGEEKLRLTIGRDPEKYGNNIDSADQFFVDIINHADAYLDRKNCRNGHFQLGAASIDYHIRYGEQTGATPDGRYAGEPLSKNIGASIGKDRNGLTALMQSATKFDSAKIPGSGVLDFLLHPSVAQGEEGLSAMAALVRAYFARGGYSLQGNVTDAATLRDAQKHPEKYEGLQVRVTGWNWNFNDMTPDYQDEIIHRLEGVE
ncbi:MAG: pyruvate formate lyase family protein [Christensenellales bacterium]